MRSKMAVFLVCAAVTACTRTEGMKLPAPGLYTVQVSGVDVDVIVPPGEVRGTLLVLPGWNFPRDSWRKNSKIEKLAEKAGLVLVLPEMGKTLYETRFFPETRMKWNPVPGSEFIKAHLVPELQTRYLILRPGQKNFVTGLSTGGRGVAVIALENPGLFTAGAAFSGDFAQEKMKQESINIAVFGPYDAHPERWTGPDNPHARASEWKMPLYLSHGLNDNVVPPEQTQLFAETLKEKHPGLLIEVRLKSGFGHDYRFWDNELSDAFAFFGRFLQE